MRRATTLSLVCCLTFSFFLAAPVQAKNEAENARTLLHDRVSGDREKTGEKEAVCESLLTFKASEEFPIRILDAIKAHFKQKRFILSNLEKQDTLQMGDKGRIYNYLCTFEGYEKQFHFFFATLYKDASKRELVYKAFFCGAKSEFDDLVEKGEKELKDTLAYDTPRFSFYKGYEETSE